MHPQSMAATVGKTKSEEGKENSSGKGAFRSRVWNVECPNQERRGQPAPSIRSSSVTTSPTHTHALCRTYLLTDSSHIHAWMDSDYIHGHQPLWVGG